MPCPLLVVAQQLTILTVHYAPRFCVWLGKIIRQDLLSTLLVFLAYSTKAICDEINALHNGFVWTRWYALRQRTRIVRAILVDDHGAQKRSQTTFRMLAMMIHSGDTIGACVATAAIGRRGRLHLMTSLVHLA